jgi:hypothetical protein
MPSILELGIVRNISYEAKKRNKKQKTSIPNSLKPDPNNRMGIMDTTARLNHQFEICHPQRQKIPNKDRRKGG